MLTRKFMSDKQNVGDPVWLNRTSLYCILLILKPLKFAISQRYVMNRLNKFAYRTLNIREILKLLSMVVSVVVSVVALVLVVSVTVVVVVVVSAVVSAVVSLMVSRVESLVVSLEMSVVISVQVSVVVA